MTIEGLDVRGLLDRMAEFMKPHEIDCFHALVLTLNGTLSGRVHGRSQSTMKWYLAKGIRNLEKRSRQDPLRWDPVLALLYFVRRNLGRPIRYE